MKANLQRALENLGFTVANGRAFCDSCDALAINGTPCHERGCPNAVHECNGCDALIPMRARYCADCQ